MQVGKLIPRFIYFSFVGLFFFTPLILSLASFELFEFPKMTFVYLITIIIACLWLLNIILTGSFYWKRTIFDLPLILILLTQFISTIISIEPHTSIFGYYSRFHGGLLSTVCYVLITFAFIHHAKKSWVRDMIMVSLASASLVGLYGLAEHLGIDDQVWVQDVKNRVFSTLGQPNWLAAYLTILLPFTIAWYLKPIKSIWPKIISINLIALVISYTVTYLLTDQELPVSIGSMSVLVVCQIFFISLLLKLSKPVSNFLEKTSLHYLALFGLFVSVILFTKSRSGILAMAVSLVIFWLSQGFNKNRFKFLILNSIFLMLVFLIGTEWTPKFSGLFKPKPAIVNEAKTPVLPYADTISESSDIRQVVWQGATNIFKAYPLFGSGTETYAYSYYQFRPEAHNQLSEWDFLYNKAHNEYLNYLANNGALGLTAIFLLIVLVIWFLIRNSLKYWLIGFAGFIPIVGLLYLISPKIIITLINKLIIFPPLLLPIGLCLGLASLIVFLLIKIQKNSGAAFSFFRAQSSERSEGVSTKKANASHNTLTPAFLAALTAIFITNFYGFSVVIVALWFFLQVGFIVLIFDLGQFKTKQFIRINYQPTLNQMIMAIPILILTLVLLIKVLNYYLADLYYNSAKTYAKQGDLLEANEQIDKAIAKRPQEANYYLEKANIISQVAFALGYKDSTQSAELNQGLIQQTDTYTKLALLKNPVHLNNYKTAAKIYLTLGYLDEAYNEKAYQILDLAHQLAPTDPQVLINLGLISQQQNNLAQAEKYFKESVELKPNYRRAWFYLAELYEEQNKIPEAKQVYEFVLTNIDSRDQHSLEKLASFKQPQ